MHGKGLDNHRICTVISGIRGSTCVTTVSTVDKMRHEEGKLSKELCLAHSQNLELFQPDGNRSGKHVPERRAREKPPESRNNRAVAGGEAFLPCRDNPLAGTPTRKQRSHFKRIIFLLVM